SQVSRRRRDANAIACKLGIQDDLHKNCSKRQRTDEKVGGSCSGASSAGAAKALGELSTTPATRRTFSCSDVFEAHGRRACPAAVRQLGSHKPCQLPSRVNDGNARAGRSGSTVSPPRAAVRRFDAAALVAPHGLRPKPTRSAAPDSTRSPHERARSSVILL